MLTSVINRLILGLVFLLAGTTLAFANERILSFDSQIQVQRNSAMLVQETIQVRVEGKKIKHGIYRDFPTRYKDALKNNYVVDFKVKSVLRDGVVENFFIKSMSNGQRVYIGRENVLIHPGVYTYTITYETNRQLGFFKDFDELYWNVNGNGWDFSIDQVSASVQLPGNAIEYVKSTDAYTGPKGARGKDFTASEEDDRIVFKTIRPLRPQEGLTIVLSWPKGIVHEPSFNEKATYFVRDNVDLIAGGIGLLILLFYFISIWWAVGVDPDKGTIIPLFHPPMGFSPAAIRYLIKMGFDDKATACAVINMAVKGYLTISEDKKVTTLSKTGQNEEKISPEEDALAKQFFKVEPTLELLEKNHSHIRKGIENFKKVLRAKYEQIYFVTNQKYFITGFLISLAVILGAALLKAKDTAGVVFMSIWLLMWSFGLIFLMAMVLELWRNVGRKSIGVEKAFGMTLFAIPFLCGEIFGLYAFCSVSSFGIAIIAVLVFLMDGIFYYLLKARTLLGRKVMDQIEGFKMYLSVAEKESIKMLGQPKKTQALFEEYLPYALALDVEQAWAEKFADILSKAQFEDGYQPSWYHGSSGFSNLGSSLSNSISSSSTAPGSNSGSGGGGSSGGGGGGGGGGGW